MKITYFCWFCFTWDVYGGWKSHSLQHGNIPKHPTRLQGWYNGTNRFSIPEKLRWWQVTEIWHIFTFWWLTWPMTLTHGVTLTSNYKNNVTNAFPVPENLGVEPLFVFIWWLVTEILRIFTFCTGLVAAILNMQIRSIFWTTHFWKHFFGNTMDPYELKFNKIVILKFLSRLSVFLGKNMENIIYSLVKWLQYCWQVNIHLLSACTCYL